MSDVFPFPPALIRPTGFLCGSVAFGVAGFVYVDTLIGSKFRPNYTDINLLSLTVMVIGIGIALVRAGGDRPHRVLGRGMALPLRGARAAVGIAFVFFLLGNLAWGVKDGFQGVGKRDGERFTINAHGEVTEITKKKYEQSPLHPDATLYPYRDGRVVVDHAVLDASGSSRRGRTTLLIWRTLKKQSAFQWDSPRLSGRIQSAPFVAWPRSEVPQ